jgi:hypothetical protein
VHEIYRLKETGEVSYERDRRIELTIGDGKVSRYEMRIVGYAARAAGLGQR